MADPKQLAAALRYGRGPYADNQSENFLAPLDYGNPNLGEEQSVDPDTDGYYSRGRGNDYGFTNVHPASRFLAMLPGPLGIAGGLFNTFQRANNVSANNAYAQDWGGQPLSFWQGLGGALGLNDYGSGAVWRGDNERLAARGEVDAAQAAGRFDPSDPRGAAPLSMPESQMHAPVQTENLDPVGSSGPDVGYQGQTRVHDFVRRGPLEDAGLSGPNDPSLWGRPGFAHGGMIPHSAGSPSRVDDVPIMADEGEFILNAEAVRKYGPLLDALNNRKVALRKADGLLR
ncbi:MAG: hypothetical protein EXR85_02330 [Xanthomonadales bacterium]|nr:hypothetical protein [Xanthomonadales bacterium]